MNPREMTPAERRREKLLNYALAIGLGLTLAWILIEGLSK